MAALADAAEAVADPAAIVTRRGCLHASDALDMDMAFDAVALPTGFSAGSRFGSLGC